MTAEPRRGQRDALQSESQSPSGTAVYECQAEREHCITCSDEGTPMRVVSADDATAVCADEQLAFHDVAIELVGPVSPGDEVIVHAGVAIRHRSLG